VPVPVIRFITARYLLGLRRRTHVAAVSTMTFATMAVGAAALVITLALLEGFQSTIRAQLLESGVHAELRPASGRELPGGPWVAELAARHGNLEFRPVRRGAVWCVGADGAAPAEVEIGGAGRVEINRVLAARLGVGAGSEVTLASARQVLTPMGPMPLRRRLVVEGVSDSAPGEERALVRVPPAAGRGLVPEGEPQLVEVKARDADRAWSLASALAGELPAGVEVVSFQQLNRPLLAALQLERAMIGLGVALVIAVAALNLLCNLTLLAAEKRADVAVLAAIGLRPARVRALFVALGVAIGALGGALGTAFGAGVAVALDRTRALPLPRGVFIVSHVPFRVTPEAVAIVLAVSVAAALVSSLAPARAAARRDLLEGLRYE